MKALILLLLISTLVLAVEEHTINKRVLPINEACRPEIEICRKGDWIAEDIASCHYKGPGSECKAQRDTWFETADVAVEDRCIPNSGKQFKCGDFGTNTRCVCSDKSVYDRYIKWRYNECKCQYWPQEDIGAHAPAFCTAYYSGGTSGISGHKLHQWTCCNNCQDPTPNTCDAETYQGGGGLLSKPISYCNSCGQSTGGGRVKYYFNCGSCETQQSCSNYCSSGWGVLDKKTPGLCWKWLECFKGCCLDSSTQPRAKRDTKLSFCGDGICSEAESPVSCPVDCCYLINSVNCTSGLSNCSQECCRDSNCCLNDVDSSNNDNNDNNNNGSNAGVRVGIPVALVLVFIISAIVIVLAMVYYRKRKQQERSYNNF